MITVVHGGITNASDRFQSHYRKSFIEKCRRVFRRGTGRYRTDDKGGVHYTVDQDFEAVRIATISGLGDGRYNGVRSLYEAAFTALDGTPPDGKHAIRSSFFAAESLFRLMFPAAGGEVQKHLEPLVNRVRQSETCNISCSKICSIL